MPGSRQEVLLACAVALVGAACASSPGSKPRSCATSAECPADARCIARACVANAPPVAEIAGRSDPVEEFALATLDGTPSHDPDPEDGVASYAWTITSVDAPCEPPVVASTTSTAAVRFACAGRYGVSLVVTDRLGRASAPAFAAVQVLPSTRPPTIVAGGDVVTGHHCSGDPLTCVTFDGQAAAPVQLMLLAAPTDPAVSIAWRVTTPPGQPLGPERRVRFSPDASSPSPLVWIETDGAAMSGDWVFTAEARDAAGVLGAAPVRVSILNSPPVVTSDAKSPLEIDHTFDAGTRRFLAAGRIPVSVVDPDGDPIVDRTASWRHTGDGPSTFEGTDEGDALTSSAVVTYVAPADALLLVGGEGLARSIELSVTDVNGATTLASWDVVVKNRAPVVTQVQNVVVGHGFDRTGSRYVASASLAGFVDPDGDPLVQAGPTLDPVCPDVIVSGGKAVVSCSMYYAGVPALANFAGTHRIQQTIADPWVQQSTATTVEIGNWMPSLPPYEAMVSVPCYEVNYCCEHDVYPNVADCLVYAEHIAGSTATFQSGVRDQDGDPLVVTYELGGSHEQVVCFPEECPKTFTLSFGATQDCNPTKVTGTATASDGLSTGKATIAVNRTCTY